MWVCACLRLCEGVTDMFLPIIEVLGLKDAQEFERDGLLE